MASNPISQPNYFAREGCAISEQDDLFTLEFPGGTLTIPPHHFQALLAAGQRMVKEWNYRVACREYVAWDVDTRKIVQFPKACPIIHCNGEAC